jgi:copper homeostasis protein
MLKLEVCCYSVGDAIVAQNAGADRIELCSGRSDGGLTPSYGDLIEAQENISIPIHPMVRPRGGDFCYSANEFNVMKNDVSLIRDLGFSGVVLGMLDVHGRINQSQLKTLISIAGGMPVTFHRAFDMCHNPFEALSILTDLGVSRILTSGQQQTAEMGLPLIQELHVRSCGPTILAGGGVRMTNVHKFISAGLKEIHTSASQTISSSMIYRRIGVHMGQDLEQDEFVRCCVDADIVSAIKNSLSVQNCQLTA